MDTGALGTDAVAAAKILNATITSAKIDGVEKRLEAESGGVQQGLVS